jgi:hypothetical protein
LATKKLTKKMKKMIFLMIISVFSFLNGISQDTVYEKVYKTINSERKSQKLEQVKVQEPLELAGAQHGCWLAMYNRFNDLQEIELPEVESRVDMITTFSTASERVKSFTDTEFQNIVETRYYFSEKPSSSDVFKKIKSQALDSEIRNIGFWVIKFEDKFEKPIWYLVCLTSK